MTGDPEAKDSAGCGSEREGDRCVSTLVMQRPIVSSPTLPSPRAAAGLPSRLIGQFVGGPRSMDDGPRRAALAAGVTNRLKTRLGPGTIKTISEGPVFIIARQPSFLTWMETTRLPAHTAVGPVTSGRR
jgi:hypothetical protein